MSIYCHQNDAQFSRIFSAKEVGIYMMATTSSFYVISFIGLLERMFLLEILFRSNHIKVVGIVLCALILISNELVFTKRKVNELIRVFDVNAKKRYYAFYWLFTALGFLLLIFTGFVLQGYVS